MEYYDISTEAEVDLIIQEVQRKYKNLSQLILPSEYEPTMAGKCVLSLYHRFEPVMKFEGHKEVLDLFVEKIKNLTDTK